MTLLRSLLWLTALWEISHWASYPVLVGIVLCTVGPRAVSGKWVCWPCGDFPGDAW